MYFVLLQSFSTPWFLCARPNNHFLIFYLLETFNNVIQYQFDGESVFYLFYYPVKNLASRMCVKGYLIWSSNICRQHQHGLFSHTLKSCFLSGDLPPL